MKRLQQLSNMADVRWGEGRIRLHFTSNIRRILAPLPALVVSEDEQLRSSAVAEGENMIYRKWSLLTGPVTILGSIVGTVAVASFLFVNNDPFLKPEERKQEASPSMK